MLALGAVTLFIANYLDVKVLVLLGEGIDVLGWNLGSFAAVHRSLLTLLLLSILALSLTAATSRFWMRWLIIGASRQMEFKFRDDLFAHLTRLPASFFNRFSTGDIMSRSTNDLEAVRLVIGPSVMYLSGTAVMLPMSLYQMVLISGRLTLLTWLPLALVAPLFYFFNNRIHARFSRTQEILSEISTRVQEILTGIRVLKAYAREEEAGRGFELLSRRYVEENIRLTILQSLFIPLMGFVISLSMLGLVWAGGMYFLARAYSVALASVVAQFEYVALPINVMWGFVIWRELPTWTTWAGASLTLASGLYILYRERKERAMKAAVRSEQAVTLTTH